MKLFFAGAAIVCLTASSHAQVLIQAFCEVTGSSYLRVSAVTDTDADGVRDYATIIPDGTLRVFSGATGVERLTVSQASLGSLGQMGAAICDAGDIDGDGLGDIALGGSFGGNSTMGFQGTVLVISGANGSILRTWQGPGMNYGFGVSLAGIGDINGDGTPDVAIGSNGETNTLPFQGAVHVYSGTNGAVLWSSYGRWTHGRYGDHIANAGDVNADGIDDVVVGAFQDSTIGLHSGFVEVLSGLDGSQIVSVSPSTPGQQVGVQVTGMGDINQDGFDDFGASSNGALPASGNIQTPLFDIYSGMNGSLLYRTSGVSFTNLGYKPPMNGVAVSDVNQDGVPDFVVTDPNVEQVMDLGRGQWTLYSGLDGSAMFQSSVFISRRHWETILDSPGDLNGDGLPEFVMGHQSGATFGRACVSAVTLPGSIGNSVCSGNANSTGALGKLAAFGSNLAAGDFLHLTATDIPDNQIVLFLSSQVQGMVTPVGSQGVLCLDHPIFRYNAQIGMSAGGTYAAEVPVTPTDGYLPVIQAGETWYFQGWHREAGNSSNLTDSVELVYQ